MPQVAKQKSMLRLLSDFERVALFPVHGTPGEHIGVQCGTCGAIPELIIIEARDEEIL